MPNEKPREEDNPKGNAGPDARSTRTAPIENVAATRSLASPRNLRDRISVAFTWVEDIVYIGLGLLLAGSALVLLVSGAISFGRGLFAGILPGQIVGQLDRILLILMIVEILYTVQVSFREHVLVPEPFLIVGLIATTRRILVLTAEFATLLDKGDSLFRNAMMELGLLTLLVVALVASLLMLRKRAHDSKSK